MPTIWFLRRGDGEEVGIRFPMKRFVWEKASERKKAETVRWSETDPKLDGPERPIARPTVQDKQRSALAQGRGDVTKSKWS